MLSRSVQLVLHYDGARFSGWQRQPGERTVQGVLEAAVSKLCGEPVAVVGAGRTDAGVHARGQAAGARVPEKWGAQALRRSMNAILPDDVWIAAAFEMRDEFHPRYSAISRSYSYYVGTDDLASSHFAGRTSWSGRNRSILSASSAPREPWRASIASWHSPSKGPLPTAIVIGARLPALGGANRKADSYSTSPPTGFFTTWSGSSSGPCSRLEKASATPK